MRTVLANLIFALGYACRRALLLICAVMWLLTHAASAHAYGTTECAATRFGSNLNCTANDVSITGIALAPGSMTSCEGGSNITLNLLLTVNFASPDRYDVGIFIANDGKSPQQLPAAGGANSCSVATLPTASPFLNLNSNSCGDGNSGINAGTGSGQIIMNNVTVPCQASSNSGGKLSIPFVVSWSQNAGNVCNSIADPVPGTTSKCNAPAGTESAVAVVVMPGITITDGLTSINAGTSTTYTVVVSNNTGIAISGSVLKSPAVSGLTIGSMSCSASGGATCPSLGGGAVGSLQGSGIGLPSMPNGGTLTFTLNGTVSTTASGTLTKTATLSLSGQTGSASDSTQVIPRADLALTMTRPASLVPGANATYTLTVSSSGPGTEPGPITVTDTLPTGLTYVSASGSGWSCSASGQDVTCTRSGPLASGASASPITLTVAVASNAAGTITNTATVTGAGYDNNGVNDIASDSYTFPSAYAYAYYAMDEVSWTGAANEVKDTSGNNRDANRVGGISTTNQLTTFGHDCRGAIIPANTALASAGVQTPVDINAVGRSGTIAFWYYNNVAWAAPGFNNYRTLLDASSNIFGQFWLVLDDTGALQFAVSDAFGFTHGLTGNSRAFAANTWHHIAINWDFNRGELSLYVDGVLDAAGSSFLLLFPGFYGNLLIGDGQILAWSNVGNSANGIIDEVRIFNSALSTADIAAIKSYAHGCTSIAPNHYELSLPTNSITCLPTTVTVTACADASSPCTSPYVGVNGETATLAASGGTLGSGTVTFNASGVASTTLSYPAAADNTNVTVTLAGETVAATSPRQCCPDGSNCSVANSCSSTFNTSGYIVSSAAGGGVASIPPQTAGVPSSTFYLRAVKSGTTTAACQPALTGTQSVNIGYECNNPATCAGSNLMSVNGGANTAIARNNNGSHASMTAVNMTFDGNGNAPFTLKYDDVGQVKLWFDKTVNSAPLTGNTNSFVVKPAGFVLSNIRQSASPNLSNPAATDANGSKFVKAGEYFSATVTAVNAGGLATPNYGRETIPESVKLTPAYPTGSGLSGAPPAVGGSFGSFSNGTATGTQFIWKDVGILSLTPSVASANYLGAGDVMGTTEANVGRFYAARFMLSSPTLVNRSDVCPTAANCPSTFTYMGEQMKANFTLTAVDRNDDGAGSLTTSQNYGGAYAKLNPAAAVAAGSSGPLVLGAVNTAATRTPFPVCGATPAHPCIMAETASGSFSSGVANVALPMTVFRNNAGPAGPFDHFKIGIAPVDTDGATVNYDLDTVNVVEGAPNHASVGSTALRYGQLWISNAHGSELLPLPVPVAAQFWNGTAFVTNSLDSITSFASGSITADNYQKPPAPLPAITISTPSITANAGISRFNINAPGQGKTGSVDLRVNTIPYLSSNRGRASFGIHKGSDRFIYFREHY